MKKILKLTLLTIFILSAITISQAQTTISSKKEKLIAELIKVMKVDTQISEITDEMLASMEKTYPIMIRGIIEKDDRFSEAEKSEMSIKINNAYQSFSKKFRERLPERIDYNKFVKDSMYPLYSKFFTEKELSDLIAFYETETGQKIVNVMPKLLKESNELATKFLLPQIIELVDEIVKEETQELKDSFAKQQSH